MESTLMQAGIDLMLYGMGVVIIFLTLLILATGAMSSLVQRYFPFVEPPRAPSPPSVRPGSPTVPTDILRAIQAALDKHRKRK